MSRPFSAPVLRSDGPSMAMRKALWTSRSRMASAKVGSPVTSCQVSIGSWLVTMGERRP
jgi:hypothetical protein